MIPPCYFNMWPSCYNTYPILQVFIGVAKKYDINIVQANRFINSKSNGRVRLFIGGVIKSKTSNKT